MYFSKGHSNTFIAFVSVGLFPKAIQAKCTSSYIHVQTVIMYSHNEFISPFNKITRVKVLKKQKKQSLNDFHKNYYTSTRSH